MQKFKQKMVAVALLTLGISLAQAAEPAGGNAEAPAKADVATATKAPDYKAKKLSRAEFDALLAHPKKLLIIDVRRPDELTKIGGFPVYLSIPNSDLAKYLDYIPRDRTIVTVSNHAARGGRAADLLAGKGFKVAGTVGVQNYEEEGGTLTKILPPPPKS